MLEDELKDELINRGFVSEKITEIPETQDETGEKLYPNIKQLENTIKEIGTHEEILIHLVLAEDNKYLAEIYTRD